MADLAEGDDAPDFTLPSSGGGTVSLQALHGKEVVLYFYPKDDTPGCTTEACAFRDAHPQFAGTNAVVLGVSPDTMDSHDRFTTKYSLPFPLLADTDHQVAEAYGAWAEKSMVGRKYMGVDRSTFWIGADGTIKKIWRKVKANGHAGEVLSVLDAAP